MTTSRTRIVTQLFIEALVLGVSVSSLEPADAEQLSLLPEEREAKRARLNATLDAIRERFGAGALEPALGKVERAGLSLQIKRGEDDAPAR